ncbi:MAG: hypothetical protein Q4D05_01315 [Acinetobacter sp.]|nr:hypothetical protein [Acinetobacter sp.]
MNTPKKVLFACVLLFSFLCHAGLLLYSTLHYLGKTRVQHGEVLITQMENDVRADLSYINPISLALIANRYATLPNVASIRILDEEQHLLVSAGTQKTRSHDLLSREVKYNDLPIGRIELSLIKTSISEVFLYTWWIMLLSLVLHLGIYIIYHYFMRPARHEYAHFLQFRDQASLQIENLQTALFNEQEKVTSLLKDYDLHAQQTQPTMHDDHRIAITFQWLETHKISIVSTTLKQPYFQICNLFLERTIQAVTKHFHMETDEVKIHRIFHQQGAAISIPSNLSQAAECALMINAVMISLLETLHNAHLQKGNWTTPAHSAIAMMVGSMNLDAFSATQQLLKHHTETYSTSIYLKTDLFKAIQQEYKLQQLDNPSNSLLRQAYLIVGLTPATSQLVQKFRDDILSSEIA